jgi:hypothetical protein
LNAKSVVWHVVTAPSLRSIAEKHPYPVLLRCYNGYL